MNEKSNVKMNNECSRLVRELAADTGIPENSVETLLERMGFLKSADSLSRLVGDDRLEEVKINDLIIGVKFDQNLIHR